MSRTSPAMFEFDALPIPRLARLLVLVGSVAFGVMLLAAFLAPLSWSMWTALAVFVAAMAGQAGLFLYVVLAGRAMALVLAPRSDSMQRR